MSYLQNEDTIKFSVSEELYSITYDDTLENLIKTRFIDDFMKIGNGHAIIKVSNVSGKDFDDKREYSEWTLCSNHRKLQSRTL